MTEEEIIDTQLESMKDIIILWKHGNNESMRETRAVLG